MSQFSVFAAADGGLSSEGVIVPGTYGDSTHFPVLTLNSRGVIVGVRLMQITGGTTPSPSGGTLLDEEGNQVLDEDGNQPLPE